MYQSRIDHDSIPAHVLPGVEKADGVLAEMLKEIEQFDVTANWRSGRTADGEPCVLLSLSASANLGRGPEDQDPPHQSAFFTRTDETIRRGLSPTVCFLTRALSLVVRDELKSIRKHLAEMVTVGDQP
ncbi:MAG: hypothetical protein ABGY75_07775 [Gemmataceae bacterium]